MSRGLQGLLIGITLVAGLFCAYELIYANNQGVRSELGSLVEQEETVPAGSDITEQEPEKPPLTGEQEKEPGKSGIPPELGESQPVPESELNSILILVNKQRSLSETYVPEDLVTAEVRFAPYVLPEKKKMRAVAAEALAQLMEGAAQENIELYCVSGYRSYATQKAIFEAKLKAAGWENATKFVAFPGQSEHQTGLAMDVTNKAGLNKSLTQDFGESPEGKWLQANAHRYGFIIRYQAGKEHITGYSYEPWHIRYVGAEAAESIYLSGLTLEEYLGAASL